MKLYNSIGPNPKIVRMFMHEKGIALPTIEVDLLAGENRQEAHQSRNPMGQMPCLELDDGSYLSEITAICEYLEDKHPMPALIGTTAEEKGEARMWARRIDLNICEPCMNGFRYSEGLSLFKSRIRTIPEAADGLKALAQDKLVWLDGFIGNNQWICGDRFTLADILLFCAIEFAGTVGQPLDARCSNLSAWFTRVKDRDSTHA